MQCYAASGVPVAPMDSLDRWERGEWVGRGCWCDRGIVFLPVMVTVRPQLLCLCISTPSLGLAIACICHSKAVSSVLEAGGSLLCSPTLAAIVFFWGLGREGVRLQDFVFWSIIGDYYNIAVHFYILSLPWTLGFTRVYADHLGSNARGYRECMQQADFLLFPQAPPWAFGCISQHLFSHSPPPLLRPELPTFSWFMPRSLGSVYVLG